MSPVLVASVICVSPLKTALEVIPVTETVPPVELKRSKVDVPDV